MATQKIKVMQLYSNPGGVRVHQAVGRMSDRSTTLSSGTSRGTLSRFMPAARNTGTQWPRMWLLRNKMTRFWDLYDCNAGHFLTANSSLMALWVRHPGNNPIITDQNLQGQPINNSVLASAHRRARARTPLARRRSRP